MAAAPPISSPVQKAPQLPRGPEFIARYCVLKHSWKGKYMRLFCIGKSCIVTINPNSIFRITNQWDFPTVVDVIPSARSPLEFQVILRKGGSTDTITFSSQSVTERGEMLTDIQRLRRKFDPQWESIEKRNAFPCRKYTAAEDWRNVHLLVSNIGVIQVDQQGHELGCYLFIHIKGIAKVSDLPNGIVIKYGLTDKLHLHVCEQPDEFSAENKRNVGKVLGAAPASSLTHHETA